MFHINRNKYKKKKVVEKNFKELNIEAASEC